MKIRWLKWMRWPWMGEKRHDPANTSGSCEIRKCRIIAAPGPLIKEAQRLMAEELKDSEQRNKDPKGYRDRITPV
jgi:hypothetical protein